MASLELKNCRTEVSETDRLDEAGDHETASSAPGPIRTGDRRIRSPKLYPAELQAHTAVPVLPSGCGRNGTEGEASREQRRPGVELLETFARSVKRKSIAGFGAVCDTCPVEADVESEPRPSSRSSAPSSEEAPLPEPGGSPSKTKRSEPRDTGRDEVDPRWDVPLVALALLVIAVGLGHLWALHYGRDQGIYAVVADAMVHGKAPYKASWDFKPPGIFLVYAIARVLFGDGVHAIRVLEALGYASLVYAFTIFSKRHVGDVRPGLFGGALAVLTHVQLEFWHTGQPESFAAILLAWALVAATWDPERRDRATTRLLWLAWGGVAALYTMASLLKPPLGGGLLVSFAFVAEREWRRAKRASEKTTDLSDSPSPLRAIVPIVVAMFVGAVIPLALTAAYFVAKGALADLHYTLFVFTPYYTKLGFRSEWFLGFVFLAIEQWSFTFSAFNVFGLALLLALPKLADKEARGALHVVGMLSFQLVGVALQAKFFPYHYGAALPFAGLLAGWGYWKLWLRVRQHGGLAVFGMATLIWLLHDARTATRDVEDGFWTRCRMRLSTVTDASIRTEVADHLYSVADVNAGENRQVAEWLAAHTKDSDSVYIWGFEPAIYDLARRRPSTRYIYNVPQRVTWGRELARQNLMADLQADPPAVIVVERRDVFPVVTGDNLDSVASLRTFPELAGLVHDRYEMVEQIGDFTVYEAKSR